MYEGSLCVCCMSTEDLVQLFVSGTESDGTENYGKMLALCLRIPVSETDGHDSICTVCISKLRDCLCFKRQALKSISILSSVNLTELITVDELKVLGLTSTGWSRVEQQNPELATHADFRAVIEENKNELNPKEKGFKTSDSNNAVTVMDNYEDNKKDVSREQRVELPAGEGEGERGGGAARGRGRGRGRPRVRSPSALPYSVARDELECRECHQTFPNYITLKVHYNSHFGRHECAHGGCGARFVTRAGLRKHAAAHQPGPFRCEHCLQEFNKLNTLQSHKRRKHGALPPYRCGECGARFHTAHRRLRHLAAAHARTQRRHACAHCDRLFRHSGERAKHVASQHAPRWAVCAQCGLRVRRASLAAHARRHLARPAPATPAPRPGRAPVPHNQRRFACKLCGKAFSQKHTLLYHIGVHARRGHFAGEPALLVADRRRAAAHHGLLSDVDDKTDDFWDESVLSDDLPDMQAASGTDEDVYIDIEDFDVDVLDDDDMLPSLGPERGAAADLHEICTNLGFSTPSDFDD